MSIYQAIGWTLGAIGAGMGLIMFVKVFEVILTGGAICVG